MATFRKRGQKWQAQVRLKGHAPLSRSFTLKTDAEAWARQTEAALERSDMKNNEHFWGGLTAQATDII